MRVCGASLFLGGAFANDTLSGVTVATVSVSNVAVGDTLMVIVTGSAPFVKPSVVSDDAGNVYASQDGSSGPQCLHATFVYTTFGVSMIPTLVTVMLANAQLVVVVSLHGVAGIDPQLLSGVTGSSGGPGTLSALVSRLRAQTIRLCPCGWAVVTRRP
jgi:hypothetical protein